MVASVVPLLLLAVSQAALISARPTSQSTQDRLLLVSSTALASASAPSCLESGFVGSFGGDPAYQDHVYSTSAECYSNLSADLMGSVALTVVEASSLDGEGESVLVWLGESSFRPSNSPLTTTADDILDAIKRLSSFTPPDLVAPPAHFAADDDTLDQTSFAPPPLSLSIDIIHASSHSAILSLPRSIHPFIDTFLPPSLVPVVLNPSVQSVAVPEERIAFLQNITKGLKYDTKVDTILSALTVKQMEKDLTYLTGEAKESEIMSRHSFNEGSREAAKWIKAQVEATGANCSLVPFAIGFTPNVICEYPSVLEDDDIVVFSGHYDSRGSFGYTRAPGADDDGSGTTQVLSIARAIASQKLSFHKKVILAFFGGEEQGLVGSHAYAKSLYEAGNKTVLLHVQADMTAYHAGSETLQLGLPASIGTEAAAELVGNISAIYVPELVVGRTAACCSDHQSFHGYGFPATQVFERNGPIVDPMYHNSGDLTQRANFDFEQLRAIAKVSLATLLEVAGFE